MKFLFGYLLLFFPAALLAQGFSCPAGQADVRPSPQPQRMPGQGEDRRDAGPHHARPQHRDRLAGGATHGQPRPPPVPAPIL